jgi:hypothetical protein
MKTKFVKTSLASILLIMAIMVQSFSVTAQADKHKNGQKGANYGGKHEKMEAQKIAFITQEVNLTPDEAKLFWPVYNEYEAKRQEMRKAFKNSDNLHKDEIDKLTEKEASQILDNQLVEAQKFVDLRKEYHTKFKSVLPSVKVLKLYDAEREFQKMLIDKIRQHKQTPPNSTK